MNDTLAGASPVDQPVRPRAQDLTGDVAWLWTHCRALGMTEKADSGLMRDDVALFAARLHDALRELVTLKATAAAIEGIQAEYQRRKPAAWDAARRILGPNVELTGDGRLYRPESSDCKERR